MNELDSHLEKTSEIFEIGSVEKKLQRLKVDDILEFSVFNVFSMIFFMVFHDFADFWTLFCYFP